MKGPTSKVRFDEATKLLDYGFANFSFKDLEGDALLLKLDEKGICVSTGSACSSGSLEPSHVLVSIGLSKELAQGSLRVTFGNENTKEDVDYLIKTLKECVEELRSCQ